MMKSHAIQLAERKHNVDLDKANTLFSNVNKTKPVWWFEIPLPKIDDFQTINLVVEDSGDVDLLQVPTDFLRSNLSGFKIRDDIQKLCLELDISTFQNRVGSANLSFKQFVL